jgi:hypothetical protein
MNLGNFKREALPGFFKDEDIQPTQKMMNSAQKYLSDMKNETTKFSNQRNNKNPIGGVEISHTSDCSDDGNIKEYKDFAKTTNAAVASIKAGCSLQYAIITNCVKTLQEQNIIACAVDQGALHSLKVRSYGEKLQAKNQRTFIDWYDTTEKKMTAMWDDFLKAITNLNNFFAELKKKYGQNISNISATKI